MNLTQSIILFLLITGGILTVYCLIGWYFNRKRLKYMSALKQDIDVDAYKDEPYFDAAFFKNPFKKQTMQMQNFKLDFRNITESDKQSSKRALTNNNGHLSVPRLNNSLWKSDSNNEENSFPERKTVKHSFISKLARYSEQGIELLNYEVKSVMNTKIFSQMVWKEQVVQKGAVKRYLYQQNSKNFSDLMELFKLDKDRYVCVKFVVEVEIANCELDREYSFKELKVREKVQNISEEEYIVQEANLAMQLAPETNQ